MPHLAPFSKPGRLRGAGELRPEALQRSPQVITLALTDRSNHFNFSGELQVVPSVVRASLAIP